MKKTIDYHKAINNYKTFDDFIEYYEEFGMEMFIECIKISRVLINPYDGEWKHKELCENIDSYLKTKNDSKIYLWNNTFNEAKIINDLYSDLYSLEIYKETEDVPAEKSFISFVATLEEYLRYLTNALYNNDEANNNLHFDFNSNFAFDTRRTEKEKILHIYDHIIYISNMILQYILFFKCKNITHDVSIEIEHLKKSFNHLLIADRKGVIQNIEEEWEFFNRKISRHDKQVETFCDSKEFLDYNIVRDRLINRKNTILRELYICQDSMQLTDKEMGISNEEKQAKQYLKCIMGVNELHYECTIIKKNKEKYNIYIDDFIKAYAVIILLAKKFINNTQNFSDNIHDICLILKKEEIIEHFVQNGISQETSEVLIKILEFETYKDIIDTPLIPFNGKYMIIPTITSTIDIAQAILSCANQFNFVGKQFENLVINELNENNIHAESEMYKDDSGQYQYDILFTLNKTLFICECKFWGEPRSIKAYYERITKCFDAYDQINRVAGKYKENTIKLKEKFSLDKNITSIQKIVLLSNAIGISNNIKDVYFTDYSTFSVFLNRKKPSISFYNNKTLYKYDLNEFPELNGTITRNKLINFINNPSTVKLANRNIEKVIREMTLSKYNIKYDVYTNKVSEFLMPDKDFEGYLNNVAEVYSIK